MTPLAPDDRRRLLRLARASLAAHLGQGEAPAEPGDVPALAVPRGAFVTLTEGAEHDLRGCVGFVEPRRGLGATVMDAVRAAAEDRRFPRIDPARLGSIRIEVSVLGPVVPVEANGVHVGIHGVIVRAGGRHGLLLPQVAVEHGWDRVTFLEHTCRKAGLPPDAWRQPQTRISAFTAEVFGEDD